MRRFAAALLIAGTVSVAPDWAACAHAQAASPFPVVPRLEQPRRPHRAALACALLGTGLVAASFPLADRADQRYRDYLNESDIGRIEERWKASVRADRIASTSLLTGEVVLAAAVYLRFVRRDASDRIALVVGPGQCAVSCRF